MATSGITLKDRATDAIRFWEPMRIVYNVVLAAIVGAYFFSSSDPKRNLTVDLVLFLFLLAVLANVAYCAAYIVDIFVQSTEFSERWRKLRWVLFAIGLTFAAILTRFFSLAIFPPSLGSP
jgi:hypothetical protein